MMACFILSDKGAHNNINVNFKEDQESSRMTRIKQPPFQNGPSNMK